LDEKRTVDADLVDKIIETICGIANIGPDVTGAVFIGIADKKSDRDRIVELDKIVAAEISSRYVVGVDREAAVLNVSVEKYKRDIVDKIANSGLSEPLRSAVLARIDCITYRGHSVLCIWVPSQDGYASVSDLVFVREGSSTKEVKGASALQSVFQRFNN
jgi:predicted HTH transcriptional regulator